MPYEGNGGLALAFLPKVFHETREAKEGSGTMVVEL
jgi:hypothetical protein